MPSDKNMEIIHFISTDRDLVKKRIPGNLMLGNVATFPAATKSHFWDLRSAVRGRVWVTVQLQHPDRWEAVCCFPACIQRADMNSECWLRAATQQSWDSDTRLCLLVCMCIALVCIFRHWVHYCALNIIFLSLVPPWFPFLMLLVFFSMSNFSFKKRLQISNRSTHSSVKLAHTYAGQHTINLTHRA